jgi:hypothetical protein
VTIQQIIERLLRSRLYRTGVLIRTDEGESADLLVHDVRYEGSRSVVVVARRGSPQARFSIPLSRITAVRDGDEAA